MLRACARLLRPGGRTALFTITVAEGLDAAMHRRAARAGPRAVVSRYPTGDLLRRAGYVDVRELDVTEDYRRTAEGWLVQTEKHRDGLRVVDPAAYDERVTDLREAVAAITDGLLRRTLLVATAP